MLVPEKTPLPMVITVSERPETEPKSNYLIREMRDTSEIDHAVGVTVVWVDDSETLIRDMHASWDAQQAVYLRWWEDGDYMYTPILAIKQIEAPPESEHTGPHFIVWLPHENELI